MEIDAKEAAFFRSMYFEVFGQNQSIEILLILELISHFHEANVRFRIRTKLFADFVN